MTASSQRASRLISLAALLVLAPLAACHKSEPPPPAAAPAPAAPGGAAAPAGGATTAASTAPLTVVSLTLGKSVGPDKKVAAEVDTYAKSDTFYVSAGTTGASPGAKLAARWSSVSHNGAERMIYEETQTIAPTGDAWTEFHVVKPEGWPAGDYKIELLLDGKSVAVKAFRVGK